MTLFQILFVGLAYSADLSIKSENQKLIVDTLLSNQSQLWGFDFLADGKVLLARKNGSLILFDPKNAKVVPVSGVPQSIEGGQGGLLDVAIQPRTQTIFLTYTEEVDGKWTTALMRAKLHGRKLVETRKIFSARPANRNSIHFGSRVAFDGKGKLWISVGDRNDRHLAQDKTTDLGKIIQMDEDGSNKKMFSLGHRNPQGLYFSLKTLQLWSAEFGPRGGDELNLIEEGKNYGWPVVTYGREYYGPRIGEGFEKIGMQSPVAHWTPSVSPSGLLLYESDRIPEWTGNFFLACLGTQQILRVVLDSKQRKLKEESLLRDQVGRVRSLRADASGAIWFTTDEGKLFRILPEAKSQVNK